MQRVFFICTAQSWGETYWKPHVDVYRRANDWVLKMELAGVRPEDIQITSNGSVINVEGIRRDSCEGPGCDFHSIEIPYSRFKRAISFPIDLKDAEISTKYEHGMLFIRISPEVDHE